jgi:hypothetical protein
MFFLLANSCENGGQYVYNLGALNVTERLFA